MMEVKAVGRWEDFVSSVYSKILPLVAFIVVIVGVIGNLFQSAFSRIEIAGVGESFRLILTVAVLTLVVVTLFAFYQIALSKDIKDVLEEKLPIHRHNPNNTGEKKEKIETSGAGALGGMVIGGVLGLILGPAGVIIGGVIGGLVGNQAEYENKRAEKERRRKQT